MLIYKVVRVQDAIELPSQLQSAEAKEKQFAVSLEEALNRTSGEGWDFVSSYGGVGSAYLIFSRNSDSSAP
jgi:hypothetical protein